MPEGTLTSAHFLKTPDYVQVTGVGDFTKIGIKRGDEGGELDPHGADRLGNPHGGLVFSNAFSAGPSGLGVQVSVIFGVLVRRTNCGMILDARVDKLPERDRVLRSCLQGWTRC